MRNKRVLSIFIALVMLFGMLPLNAFANASVTANLSMTASAIDEGGYFTVDVRTTAVDGFYAADLWFHFNPDVLEVVDADSSTPSVVEAVYLDNPELAISAIDLVTLENNSQATETTFMNQVDYIGTPVNDGIIKYTTTMLGNNTYNLADDALLARFKFHVIDGTSPLNTVIQAYSDKVNMRTLDTVTQEVHNVNLSGSDLAINISDEPQGTVIRRLAYPYAVNPEYKRFGIGLRGDLLGGLEEKMIDLVTMDGVDTVARGFLHDPEDGWAGIWDEGHEARINFYSVDPDGIPEGTFKLKIYEVINNEEIIYDWATGVVVTATYAPYIEGYIDSWIQKSGATDFDLKIRLNNMQSLMGYNLKVVLEYEEDGVVQTIEAEVPANSQDIWIEDEISGYVHPHFTSASLPYPEEGEDKAWMRLAISADMNNDGSYEAEVQGSNFYHVAATSYPTVYGIHEISREAIPGYNSYELVAEGWNLDGNGSYRAEYKLPWDDENDDHRIITIDPANVTSDALAFTFGSSEGVPAEGLPEGTYDFTFFDGEAFVGEARLEVRWENSTKPVLLDITHPFALHEGEEEISVGISGYKLGMLADARAELVIADTDTVVAKAEYVEGDDWTGIYPESDNRWMDVRFRATSDTGIPAGSFDIRFVNTDGSTIEYRSMLQSLHTETGEFLSGWVNPWCLSAGDLGNFEVKLGVENIAPIMETPLMIKLRDNDGVVRYEVSGAGITKQSYDDGRGEIKGWFVGPVIDKETRLQVEVLKSIGKDLDNNDIWTPVLGSGRRHIDVTYMAALNDIYVDPKRAGETSYTLTIDGVNFDSTKQYKIRYSLEDEVEYTIDPDDITAKQMTFMLDQTKGVPATGLPEGHYEFTIYEDGKELGSRGFDLWSEVHWVKFNPDPKDAGYTAVEATISVNEPEGVNLWEVGDSNLSYKIYLDKDEMGSGPASVNASEELQFALPLGLSPDNYWIDIFRNGNCVAHGDFKIVYEKPALFEITHPFALHPGETDFSVGVQGTKLGMLTNIEAELVANEGAGAVVATTMVEGEEEDYGIFPNEDGKWMEIWFKAVDDGGIASGDYRIRYIDTKGTAVTSDDEVMDYYDFLPILSTSTDSFLSGWYNPRFVKSGSPAGFTLKMGMENLSTLNNSTIRVDLVDEDSNAVLKSQNASSMNWNEDGNGEFLVNFPGPVPTGEKHLRIEVYKWFDLDGDFFMDDNEWSEIPGSGMRHMEVTEYTAVNEVSPNVTQARETSYVITVRGVNFDSDDVYTIAYRMPGDVADRDATLTYVSEYELEFVMNAAGGAPEGYYDFKIFKNNEEVGREGFKLWYNTPWVGIKPYYLFEGYSAAEAVRDVYEKEENLWSQGDTGLEFKLVGPYNNEGVQATEHGPYGITDVADDKLGLELPIGLDLGDYDVKILRDGDEIAKSHVVVWSNEPRAEWMRTKYFRQYEDYLDITIQGFKLEALSNAYAELVKLDGLNTKVGDTLGDIELGVFPDMEYGETVKVRMGVYDNGDDLTIGRYQVVFKDKDTHGVIEVLGPPFAKEIEVTDQLYTDARVYPKFFGTNLVLDGLNGANAPDKAHQLNIELYNIGQIQAGDSFRVELEDYETGTKWNSVSAVVEPYVGKPGRGNLAVKFDEPLPAQKTWMGVVVYREDQSGNEYQILGTYDIEIEVTDQPRVFDIYTSNPTGGLASYPFTIKGWNLEAGKSYAFYMDEVLLANVNAASAEGMVYTYNSPISSGIHEFRIDDGTEVIGKRGIDFKAGEQQPTPAAPTAPAGGAENDMADIFTFVVNPLFANIGDYEYSISGGVAGSWNPLPAGAAKADNNITFTVGNIAIPAGQLKVRVKADSGSGRPFGNALASETAFTMYVPQPAAPTEPIVDDTDDTFAFTANPEYPDATDYEYNLDNGIGEWETCSSFTISVGNVAIPSGYVQVRVKADTGSSRPAGMVLASAAAFTMFVPQPAAPTEPIVDDEADTFAFTANPEYPNATDYEYNLDNGIGEWETCTSFTINIGNVEKPSGYVQVRVKADTGSDRPAGEVLASDAEFTIIQSGSVMTISKGKGLPGSAVEIVITANDVTDVRGGTLWLPYNDSIAAPIATSDISWGAALAGFTKTRNIDTNTKTIKLSFADDVGIFGDVEICRIRYTINSSAALGSVMNINFSSLRLNNATDTFVPGSVAGEVMVIPLYGDVDGDGTVTAGDAALILRNEVGLSTLSDSQLLTGDVSGDGQTNALDATQILMHLVGNLEHFPVEDNQ